MSEKLEHRIQRAGAQLREDTAKALLLAIRNKLIRAWKDDLMSGGAEAIQKYVQIAGTAPKYSIFGGELRQDGEGRATPFDRDPQSARLFRNDGAWFHFTLTVGESTELELLAYSFELVFPKDHVPPFIRFDLNEATHENAAREIRSHFHPGNDDLLCPAPMMRPDEIIDLFFWKLGPRDPENPRR